MLSILAFLSVLFGGVGVFLALYKKRKRESKLDGSMKEEGEILIKRIDRIVHDVKKESDKKQK